MEKLIRSGVIFFYFLLYSSVCFGVYETSKHLWLDLWLNTIKTWHTFTFCKTMKVQTGLCKLMSKKCQYLSEYLKERLSELYKYLEQHLLSGNI